MKIKIIKFKFMAKLKANVKNFLVKRNVKYNSLISILVVIFIALVIIFNLLVSIFVDRYDIKLDLSSKNLYKISSQTQNFLKTYNKDVSIILLNDEDTLKDKNIFTKHMYNTVKNMASYNSHISLEFVNLDEHPNFASKYSKFSLKEDSILIVGKNGGVQYIPVEKLIDRHVQGNPLYGGTVSTCSNVENMVAHALEFIFGENKVVCAYLQGHDELDFSPAVGVFGENGYELKSLNLITRAIPDDLNLIFLLAPKIDYKEEEIKKLDDFLRRGGKLVYFASAMQPKLNNLDSFFTNFGINLQKGVVVETSPNKMLSQAPNFIFSYADKSNKYTENISDKKRPILVNDCRPIKIEKQKDSSVEITDICSTSNSCAIYDEDGSDFNFKDMKKETFPLAVGVNKKIGDNKSAKITVFSSLYILDTIEVPQYGNGEFIFSVLGETAEHKSKINILPKFLDSPPLVIDAAMSNLIAVLFIFVVPFGVALVGIFINIRRKRR